MISLLIRFFGLVVLAAAFAWLADQPGDLKLRWLGYEIETSLLAATIALFAFGLACWMIWSLLMWVLDRPGAFGSWFKSRRQAKGREALSSGLIAVAAGDRDGAQSHAKTAAAILGDDPMAKLLSAQAAQLRGDSTQVKRLFEEMAQHPDTRLLGLRGLHTEAVRQSDKKRALALAEEAVRLNPKVSWASQALLSYQSANQDWAAIDRTIDQQASAKLIDKPIANAKRAAVLTARAQETDGKSSDETVQLALRAHKLDPSLVPAALIASRQLSLAGSLRKASRILEKTWKLSPHPDLAEAYAHLRAGDSALDRLRRVRSLVGKSGGIEGAVAIAAAGIEALEWKVAREALQPFAHDRPQARICGLMAEIEEGEFGDKGRAREWLARAVRAPRDPAWTADGYVAQSWLPVSPVTGELAAFTWKVPVEGIAYDSAEQPLPGEADEDDAVPGDDAVLVASNDDDQAPDVNTSHEDVDASNEDDLEDQEPEEIEDIAQPDAPVEVPDHDAANTSKIKHADDSTLDSPDDGRAGRQVTSRQPDDPGIDEATEPDERKKGWL